MAATRLLFIAKNRLLCLSHLQIRLRSKKAILAAKEREEQGLQPIDELAYNHIEKKDGLFKPKHTIEEQIKYMDSEIFKKTYQGLPIFRWYRRNIIGQYKLQPPPRLFCIDKHGRFNLNHACPVCRDEYLFFDYRNPKLIEMFLLPGTDKPVDIFVSGLCREQYVMLKAQFLKAKEYGTMTFAVQFRHFDYKNWYSNWENEEDYELSKEINFNRNKVPIENIYADPEVLFETHNRDVNTDWDEWWLRHKKFARLSR